MSTSLRLKGAEIEKKVRVWRSGFCGFSLAFPPVNANVESSGRQNPTGQPFGSMFNVITTMRAAGLEAGRSGTLRKSLADHCRLRAESTRAGSDGTRWNSTISVQGSPDGARMTCRRPSALKRLDAAGAELSSTTSIRRVGDDWYMLICAMRLIYEYVRIKCSKLHMLVHHMTRICQRDYAE